MTGDEAWAAQAWHEQQDVLSQNFQIYEKKLRERTACWRRRLVVVIVAFASINCVLWTIVIGRLTRN